MKDIFILLSIVVSASVGWAAPSPDWPTFQPLCGCPPAAPVCANDLNTYNGICDMGCTDRSLYVIYYGSCDDIIPPNAAARPPMPNPFIQPLTSPDNSISLDPIPPPMPNMFRSSPSNQWVPRPVPNQLNMNPTAQWASSPNSNPQKLVLAPYLLGNM